MPDLTPRLALRKPLTSDPATQLRTAIAENATLLDNAMLYLSGLFADRPAHGVPGRHYRATDNGKVYLDIGTGWVETLVDGSVTTAKLADNAVTNAKLADNAVTSAEIADGAVADTDLASPNNGVWRTVARFPIRVNGASVTLNNPYSPGADGSLGGEAPLLVPLVAADFAVPGKTTKLKLRWVATTNNVVNAQNANARLVRVTGSGGASGNVVITTTSVSSNLNMLLALPSSVINTELAEFAFPSDGVYTVEVQSGGAWTAGFVVAGTFVLLMRHV